MDAPAPATPEATTTAPATTRAEATARHSLMKLTLASEDLGASRGPESARKRLSKRATARMVDSLPSPVSSASSKDFASASKRRGFSAPSLKRSVTAVSRMTDRLPSIPSLSRSTSSDAQAQAAAASSTATAPTLQRAKTESAGASSTRGAVAMVTDQPGKAALTQVPTRTGIFGPLHRADKAKSADALPSYAPEERLCPLDSPVNAAPIPRGPFSGRETESKPSETEFKFKRMFAPGIPSLVRTSSKDSSSPPPTQSQELPPAVSLVVAPPTLEDKGDHPSPKQSAPKGTPKRSKRKFAMPSLRRSSTSSSEKSVSSFVVPTSEATANSNTITTTTTAGSSSEESTMESPLEEDDDEAQDTGRESEAASAKSQKFGIPSLLRSLTGANNSKRRSSGEKKDGRQSMDGELPSPKPVTTQTQPASPATAPSITKPRKSMLPPVSSSTKAAARFFSGMNPMTRRSGASSKGSDKPASAKAKTPSTTEDDFSDTNADDDDEVEEEEDKEKEMHLLLHILQVPRGRRGSTLPLMSTGQEEVSI